MSGTPEQPKSRYEISPYGPVAAELGLAAVRAVNVLADIPEWHGETERKWLLSDHVAFEATINFAHWAHEAQARLAMPEDEPEVDSLPFSWYLDDIHESLPFREGERHWLIRYCCGASGYGGNDVTRNVVEASNSEYVTGFNDAGRWQKTDAQKILDDWWAWRRAAFEYEEGAGVDSACKDLCAVAEITVPRVPLSQKALWLADTKPGEIKRVRRAQRDKNATFTECHADTSTAAE